MGNIQKNNVLDNGATHLIVPDIEKAVLGAILFDKSNLQFLDILESDDFPIHSNIFENILFLFREAGIVDNLELDDLLKKDGNSINSAELITKASFRPKYHIELLKDYTRRRKIYDLSYKIQDAANDNSEELFELIDNLKALENSSYSLVQSAKLDFNKEILSPQTVLRINDETFGTLGNFSLIIGKAKSRKTFLITLALAGAVSSKPIFDTFAGTLPKDKKRVIFIDTEQGEYHVKKVAERVIRLSGIENPDNFDVYALRKFDTKQRNAIIEDIIRNTPDLGLLVIDGVRDIVTSINDEEQATDLANKLLKWTEERRIHIITVLHQNKSDFNARGHIGTELINKAEITVSVTVDSHDKEISKVESEYCRHKEFEPFAIRINDNGLPERVNGWTHKKESNIVKPGPSEIDEYKHFEVLQELKKNVNGNKLGFGKVLDQIKYAVEKKVENIGDTKAREFFTDYLNRGFLIKHGKDHSPQTFYEVNPDFSNKLTQNNVATLN